MINRRLRRWTRMFQTLEMDWPRKGAKFPGIEKKSDDILQTLENVGHKKHEKAQKFQALEEIRRDFPNIGKSGPKSSKVWNPAR